MVNRIRWLPDTRAPGWKTQAAHPETSYSKNTLGLIRQRCRLSPLPQLCGDHRLCRLGRTSNLDSTHLCRTALSILLEGEDWIQTDPRSSGRICRCDSTFDQFEPELSNVNRTI